MTANTLISVIVPVYNAEAYLSQTLSSVLGQTYTDLEVICVNDGSTDGSAAILGNFARKDPRLRVLTISNSGQSAASNHGLAVATGTYIKFIDADDVIAPDHLEHQFNAVRDFPGYLASCKWAAFYDADIGGASIRKESVWQDMTAEDWLVAALTQPQGDMMAGWVWLIPREILDGTGGWNEDLSLNNDFEFSVRVLLASKGVKFAEQAVLYHRGDNPGSVSAQMSEKAAQSAYLTTRLGCDMLLESIKRDEIRLICANRYQIWMHRLYPGFPDIVSKMQLEVDSLGGSNRTLRGGPLFQCVQYCLGWRFAKRLRLLKARCSHYLARGARN